jgi:hypothetical protein
MATYTQANRPLSASLDAKDSSRIIFNQLVTLDEARRYLWRQPPSQDTLRADPAERSVGGKQRQFLIKKEVDLVMSLQHGLSGEYLKRLRPISSTAKPTELGLGWIPNSIRDTILSGKLPRGITRFPGTKPWGDIVVWIDPTGAYISIQAYQEYPEDMDFYLNITRGDGNQARLLHQVYTGYNKDMSYFVEKQRLSPDLARAEIRRINDEVFKLVIEASVNILSAAAGISSIGNSLRSSANKVIETAESTNFASAKSQAAVEEIKLSQQEYKAALGRVFPSHQLDSVARTVDDIAQRAAARLAKNPDFLKAMAKRDWTTAGNLFHNAAKDEARAVPAGALPLGWKLTAEETIQSGKGGSRLDLFLRGPGSERVEFDWKTTGKSALTSGARKEMAKHAGHILSRVGGTETSQQSRSWVDYVRPYFPSLGL